MLLNWLLFASRKPTDFFNICMINKKMILLLKVFTVIKHYLCKSRSSFATFVPVLPAPSNISVDVPGTLIKDFLEDPKS